MKNHTRLVLFIALVTAAPLVLGDEDARPSDPELAADLKLMQGTWELLHGQGADGEPTIRSVKTITGNKETLRRYSIATGAKTHEHSVEFQLSKSGAVHVLTFYAVGGSSENGLSFVYKVEQDNFFDIPGLLHGSQYRNYQDKTTIWRWKRVANGANPNGANPAETGTSAAR